jgi:Mce-associated membrane protein
MAKHPIPPKRRRHVVAGQRRLVREQLTDFAPTPTREVPNPPAAPPVSPVSPQVETRPAPAPAPAAAPVASPPAPAVAEKGARRRLRPRFSVPAGWRDVTSPAVVVAVLTALVIALATLGGFVFDTWQHDRAVAQAKQDSVVAARAAMGAVLSYNYQTIDADITHAESYLTGTFRTEYRTTAEKTVKDAAVRYKASVKAEVVYAGAITATPNTARVLIFVNQTVNNTLIRAPRVDTPRVRLEMRKVHGKWLVSKLDSL